MLLTIASLLTVALMLMVPNPVGANVRVALCKIFGGTDCTAEPLEYKPPTSACVVSTDSHKVGGSVSVFSVKIGENLQFVKIKYANGQTRLMIVPADYKLGRRGRDRR